MLTSDETASSFEITTYMFFLGEWPDFYLKLKRKTIRLFPRLNYDYALSWLIRTPYERQGPEEPQRELT